MPGRGANRRIPVRFFRAHDILTSPLYETGAAFDMWLKWLIAATVAITLIPGIVLLSMQPVISWVFIGTTAFDALLFHGILPRRFQVFENRLRIVLGQPFAFNVPFDTIRGVRTAERSLAYVYWGLRLATSARHIVEIDRSSGLSMVISPSDREMFIGQLTQALLSASERNHG